MNKWEKEVQASLLRSEQACLTMLERQYQRSVNQIMQQVKLLDADIDSLTDALSEGYDPNDPKAEKEYERLQSMYRSKIYQKQYQEQLKTQVDGILEKMHTDNYKTIDSYLKTAYTDAYTGTMYDIANQLGVALVAPIDQVAVTRAVLLDSKISTKSNTKIGMLYDAVGVEKIKKSVVKEVSRGIATAQSYQQISTNLDNAVSIGFRNAARIVRTEGHRIQQASTLDAQRAAKNKGADVVKQWDAALDDRTRESHRLLDGQIREIDEPFEVNGLKADAPGYFGIAAEDCNCRCASLTRARWALDEEELKTLQDRAAYFGLDKTSDFEDFKTKYLQAAEEDNPKNVFQFVPAKTLEDAEAFIKKYVDDSTFGALGISYKGISLESANEINRSISELFTEYDFPKLGGVYVAKGNTKLGQLIQNAQAAYSPIRNSLLINNISMKDIATVLKGKEEELELIKAFKENPSSFIFKTEIAKKTAFASLLSGRATVPDDISSVITHEFGHSLEKTIKKSSEFDKIVSRMGSYAEKISGYATVNVSEYIAESFASYRKGERIIDPILSNLFDGIKKKNGAILKDTLGLTVKNIEKIGNTGILVSDKQFGKKVGEHAKDYGLDPSKKEDRDKFSSIINDIIINRDSEYTGEWRGYEEPVTFFVKDEDLVIVSEDNSFISILKGGVNNERFKNTRREKV